MMASLLITNAQIVNEDSIVSGDLLVRDGRIVTIGGDLQSQPADQVLDAAGRFLLPGMIDSQVFSLQSGSALLTEGRAALAGGVTTAFELPNIELEAEALSLEERKQQCDNRSAVNYGFYWGATHDNLEAVKALEPDAVCAVSVFTGGGNTRHFVDEPELLEKIFTHAPVLVAAQCEDTPTILENEESYRGIYGDQIPMNFHPVIRSEEACYLSSGFAIGLAKDCGNRLHLMNISTAREVEALQGGEVADHYLSAEISLPYLHFSDEDYAVLDTLIKARPAIKSDEDRAGLIQGLLDGRLESIGSGHIVVPWAAKKQSSYFKVAAGIPMLQHALPVLLEHYHDGIFSLEFIVEKTSHAVARRFDILERGYIREGYWADLVLLDFVGPVTPVGPVPLFSSSQWSPFSGYEFRSRIAATLVNGQIAYQDGQFKALAGLPVMFERAI